MAFLAATDQAAIRGRAAELKIGLSLASVQLIVEHLRKCSEQLHSSTARFNAPIGDLGKCLLAATTPIPELEFPGVSTELFHRGFAEPSEKHLERVAGLFSQLASNFEKNGWKYIIPIDEHLTRSGWKEVWNTIPLVLGVALPIGFVLAAAPAFTGAASDSRRNAREVLALVNKLAAELEEVRSVFEGDPEPAHGARSVAELPVWAAQSVLGRGSGMSQDLKRLLEVSQELLKTANWFQASLGLIGASLGGLISNPVPTRADMNLALEVARGMRKLLEPAPDAVTRKVVSVLSLQYTRLNTLLSMLNLLRDSRFDDSLEGASDKKFYRRVVAGSLRDLVDLLKLSGLVPPQALTKGLSEVDSADTSEKLHAVVKQCLDAVDSLMSQVTSNRSAPKWLKAFASDVAEVEGSPLADRLKARVTELLGEVDEDVLDRGLQEIGFELRTWCDSVEGRAFAQDPKRDPLPHHLVQSLRDAVIRWQRPERAENGTGRWL